MIRNFVIISSIIFAGILVSKPAEAGRYTLMLGFPDMKDIAIETMFQGNMGVRISADMEISPFYRSRLSGGAYWFGMMDGIGLRKKGKGGLGNISFGVGMDVPISGRIVAYGEMTTSVGRKKGKGFKTRIFLKYSF